MSYVLLAVAQNKNDSYAVRIIVDKNTNTISEISTYGLYGIRAKKEGALFLSEDNEGVENTSVPYLSSYIRISDLLQKVKSNELINEILSKDVAAKLNVQRNKGELNESLRYSLPDTVEKDVFEKYGRTFSWNTTGYILKNGTKLDLSGKSVGAPGGYRALDHRDIFDIYEVDSYTDAMIEFMARGNMAVVVNMKNKKYYVHRIILPDGSAFRFKKIENANQEMYQGVPNGSLANTTRLASMDSISKISEKINTSDGKSSEEIFEGRSSLSDTEQREKLIIRLKELEGRRGFAGERSELRVRISELT